MAYISTDEVKAVRVALKEHFKNKIKFSVRREHYSSLNVSITSGEINFYDGSLDRKDPWHKEAPDISLTVTNKSMSIILKITENTNHYSAKLSIL